MSLLIIFELGKIKTWIKKEIISFLQKRLKDTPAWDIFVGTVPGVRYIYYEVSEIFLLSLKLVLSYDSLVHVHTLN